MIFNSPQQIMHGLGCLNENTFKLSKLNLNRVLIITDSNILKVGEWNQMFFF